MKLYNSPNYIEINNRLFQDLKNNHKNRMLGALEKDQSNGSVIVYPLNMLACLGIDIWVKLLVGVRKVPFHAFVFRRLAVFNPN